MACARTLVFCRHLAPQRNLTTDQVIEPDANAQLRLGSTRTNTEFPDKGHFSLCWCLRAPVSFAWASVERWLPSKCKQNQPLSAPSPHEYTSFQLAASQVRRKVHTSIDSCFC